MANSTDTDEMPHSAASYLGLHCLLRPVCLNTHGKYVISRKTCIQRRFRPAYASGQSDQNLHCMHFGSTRMQNFFMQTREIDQTVWMRRVILFFLVTLEGMFSHVVAHPFIQRTCYGGVFGDNSGIIFLISP